MKSLFGGTTLALTLVAMLATACGDDDDGGSSKSPAQLCNNTAVATCKQVYKCLTPALITAIGFPDTEAACVSEQKASLGCDSFTADNACTGSEKYHVDQHSKCVDQVNAAECSQVLAAGENVGTYAPACDMICVVD